MLWLSPMFGPTLRHLRTSRKMHLDEISAAIGVTTQYLSDVELGRRAPLTHERIRRVADALELGRRDVVALLASAARERGEVCMPADGLSQRRLELVAEAVYCFSSMSEAEAAAVGRALGLEAA